MDGNQYNFARYLLIKNNFHFLATDGIHVKKATFKILKWLPITQLMAHNNMLLQLTCVLQDEFQWTLVFSESGLVEINSHKVLAIVTVHKHSNNRFKILTGVKAAAWKKSNTDWKNKDNPPFSCKRFSLEDKPLL